MSEMTIDQKVDKLVREDVLTCASTLIYEMREVAENLDDYETYLTLTGGCPDYEEAASNFIFNDADASELEEVVDQFGWWESLLTEAEVPEDWEEQVEASDDMVDLDDFLKKHDLYPAVRQKVWDEVASADEGFETVCRQQNLDPEYNEVYEHWIVSDWLGSKLKDHGMIVEDYMGLTIWGRCTTGQSISMDYVIRKIAEEML